MGVETHDFKRLSKVWYERLRSADRCMNLDNLVWKSPVNPLNGQLHVLLSFVFFRSSWYSVPSRHRGQRASGAICDG